MTYEEYLQIKADLSFLSSTRRKLEDAANDIGEREAKLIDLLADYERTARTVNMPPASGEIAK